MLDFEYKLNKLQLNSKRDVAGLLSAFYHSVMPVMMKPNIN